MFANSALDSRLRLLRKIVTGAKPPNKGGAQKSHSTNPVIQGATRISLGVVQQTAFSITLRPTIRIIAG
jgi:hypothetical protein